VIAERLLQLKDSDPELFSQAWRKIPQSTQDNILAYLKRHGGEGQLSISRHENFEDKNSLLHKHRGSTEHLSDPTRFEHKEQDSKNLVSPLGLVETRKGGQSLGRPLFEWTDGELLAHTLLDTETKEGSASGQGKTEDSLVRELRSISRQNTVQIVQNELIRRLLQTIAGKT